MNRYGHIALRRTDHLSAKHLIALLDSGLTGSTDMLGHRKYKIHLRIHVHLDGIPLRLFLKIRRMNSAPEGAGPVEQITIHDVILPILK